MPLIVKLIHILAVSVSVSMTHFSVPKFFHSHIVRARTKMNIQLTTSTMYVHNHLAKNQQFWSVPAIRGTTGTSGFALFCVCLHIYNYFWWFACVWTAELCVAIPFYVNNFSSTIIEWNKENEKNSYINVMMVEELQGPKRAQCWTIFY